MCLQSGLGSRLWQCCRLLGALITGLQQFTCNCEFTGVVSERESQKRGRRVLTMKRESKGEEDLLCDYTVADVYYLYASMHVCKWM